MIAELRRRFRMLAPGARVRWASMAPLGLAAALLEAAGGALVFTLLALLLDPSAGDRGPVIAFFRAAGATPVTLAVAAAVVHIVKNLLVVAFACWRARVAAADTASLSTRVLRAYMSAPWPFHLRRSGSMLVETVRESARPFFDAFDAAAIIVAETAAVAALAAVSLVLAPVAVTFAVTGIVAAMALVLRITRAAQQAGGARQFKLGAALYRHVLHGLGALKELRVLGRDRYFVEAFERDARAAASLETRRAGLDALPRMLVETAFGLGILALAVLGASGGTLAGMLPLVGLYAYAGFRIAPALHRIALQVSNLRWSLAASAPLVDDLARLDAVPARRTDDATPRLELREALVAEHVSFAYEGAAANVLSDITVVVRRGESVAIAGPTASGKTTLVDVLIGLLPPSSGHVLVDGRNIHDHLAAWHCNVGYVPQMPFLMDDTLRRNIALGLADSHIDERAIASALSLARLDALVARLPQGLDTPIGEGGVRLSGGERQRVAIARALYRNPEVIVFDEATSALDDDTEREIAEAIETLRGRTIIVVAHRQSTIARCDRVMYLANGQSCRAAAGDLRAQPTGSA